MHTKMETQNIEATCAGKSSWQCYTENPGVLTPLYFAVRKAHFKIAIETGSIDVSFAFRVKKALSAISP